MANDAQATADALQIETRAVLADVYTFVRSRSLARQIGNYTLDHYIEEAKARIKDKRLILNASGSRVSAVDGVGTRPSRLDQLLSLKNSFDKALENGAFEKLAKLQDSSDSPGE